MSMDIWFAFVLASIALQLLPGPTVMLVVSYALNRGRDSGYATVPGAVLGDFIAMTISLAGAGAILATSATLFTVLKLCGAAYLFYLGIKLWRTPIIDASAGAGPQKKGTKSLFWSSCLVTALNPKSIAFFVSFLPQFVDPAGPVLMQFAILEVTFLLLAAITTALWVLFAAALRHQLTSPLAQRIVNRRGGGLMMGAGFMTALARRSA